jgi:hypothetical protein
LSFIATFTSLPVKALNRRQWEISTHYQRVHGSITLSEYLLTALSVLDVSSFRPMTKFWMIIPLFMDLPLSDGFGVVGGRFRRLI